MAVCAETTESVCFSDLNNDKRMFVALNNIRESGKLCDVTLRISGKFIRVHANVLTAASSYFSTVLGVNDLPLDTSNSPNGRMINPQILHINVDTYSEEDQENYYKALVKIVDYIYTGEISLTNDCVSEVLQLSKVLLLDEITVFSEKFINDSPVYLESQDTTRLIVSQSLNDANRLRFIYKRFDESKIVVVKHDGQIGYKSNKCRSCDFVGINQRELREHRHVKHIKKFFGVNCCAICDMEFDTRDLCDEHKRLHLVPTTDPSLKYPCAFCATQYRWKWELRKHMVRHRKGKNFTCPLCGGKYKREKTLQVHMQLHKRRDVSDDNRGGKLRIKPVDDSLIRDLTQPNLQYKCHECQFESSNKDDLRSHLLAQHLIGEVNNGNHVLMKTVATNRRLKPFTKRPRSTAMFPCTMCERVFNHKHVLHRHILDIHSTQRPFKCTECNFDTKRRGNLKDHMWYRHKVKLSPFYQNLVSQTFI